MLPLFDPWLSAAMLADVAAATSADAQALAVLQKERMGRLIASAAQCSPLYRGLLAGRDPSHLMLQDIPITRKADLMRRFDDWVTDADIRLDALRAFTCDPFRIADPFLGRYVVWESSGSSGEPGLFVQDAMAMAVNDAIEALRRPSLRPSRRWMDPWGLSERFVFVGATGGHFASIVSVERLRRLNPALSCGLHSVSFLQPIRELGAQVQAFAPTVIATYPSVAVLLAEEQLAGRVNLAPKEVWTGGETLSDAMREFVQQAFSCPVTNSYGASEFLTLAFECRCGCLHVNSDWAILESVDDRGCPVPAGVLGDTTLLTNLANQVQPLIRYDLGDRIMFRPEPCACGSHLPAIEVQGRSDDMLRLGKPSVCVLPLALSTVLEDDAGLFDFQLVQQGPCELLLSTGMCGPAASEALRRARPMLAAFLARLGAADVQIHCRTDRPARRERSGKVQRIVALPRSEGVSTILSAGRSA
jgi:phenylacetate-coenzyme A ligase PaaK-like adenylate-forming protein